MHRGVVGEVLGEAVPLATGAQSEDDSVQGGPLVDAPSAGALGWIMLSARMGSIFSHNWSGTRQMVGSGFSWKSCSLIEVSSRSDIAEIIADRESFEIISKWQGLFRAVFASL